jgi:hypothetical protein
LLNPKTEDLKYLFIGTFNPEWNSKNDNNAEYFYGRSTNNFWCILPHTFDDNCLIDKSITEWTEYCALKNIGITDIIREITNAEITNNEHYNLITRGYSDNNLDKRNGNDYIFTIDFNTSIILEIIRRNKKTLQGAYFTRKTDSGIPRIWEQWILIKNYCNENNINCNELITPSNYGPGIKKSIIKWKEIIFPAPIGN